MTDENNKQDFDYVKARKAVDLWVDHLNNEYVNWAWDIFIGTAEVYANCNVKENEKYTEALAAVYYDFFDAWHGGAANLGIIGIMQELDSACPAEHNEDMHRIMELAWAAGRTGVGVPKKQTYCFSKTEGTKYRPVVARPEAKVAKQPAGIKLIVDNTKEAK